MTALYTLLSVGWFVVQIAIVIAIPWSVIRLGHVAVDRVAPSGFFEVPAVLGLARLLGILVAVLLLSGRADVFNLRLVFGPQSPWDLTIWQFLAASANPLWSLRGLAGEIAEHGVGALSASLAVLILVSVLAVLVTPFVFWRGSAPWRAAAGGACVAIITTYVTIYGVSLLFWLLFLLNFWILGLLLVILQWYRSRH
jgi:hypothetical protein